MRINCQSRTVLGCLCWLALASCKDEPTDVIENVGGSAGAAGSGGATSQAGTAGATSQAGAAGTAGSGGNGPVTGQNLFTNPSFETAGQGWRCIGNCTTSIVNDTAHSGSSSLFVMNRTQQWEGPSSEIEDLVDPGTDYQIKGWLRRGPGGGDGGPPLEAQANISLKRTCTTDANATYSVLTSGALQADWFQLSATFEAPECELTELLVFFDGPPPDVEFYLDDVSLTAMP